MAGARSWATRAGRHGHATAWRASCAGPRRRQSNWASSCSSAPRSRRTTRRRSCSGPRSRRLWPAGAADHAGPPPRRKGKCLLHFDDLAEHADGLLAAVLLHYRTRRTPALQELTAGRDYASCSAIAAILARHRARGPRRRRTARVPGSSVVALRLAARRRQRRALPRSARRPLHDVLTAIRHGTTVARARRAPAFPTPSGT